MSNYIRIVLIFILLPLSFAFSQSIVSGFIRDAKTKEPLPAANIQIEGTMRGTITNKDGKFVLELEQLPSTIFVSYIGYESKRLTISRKSKKLEDIQLKPVIFETEAIVVLAEDPGMGIMREVIKRKKEWRKKLHTYQADAYSRLVLSNDSGIVFIAESTSEAFWDLQKGPREVIKSKRQTNNLQSKQNFAVASHIPNFYDDDIDISGFKIIGPTHPSAFDYYKFKLVNKRYLDEKIVFGIDVIPTSKLQPTFIGHVSVLDEEFAMINVDLKPNETILFPMPVQEWNLFYKQQFSNFGQEFWLPIDVRIDGDIKIGITGLQFPTIKYSQISHLNDYKVNIELPDSLYQEKKIVSVDSTSLESDSLFASNAEVIPLSEKEESAYQNLDSTMTLEKAFQPTGFLAKFIKIGVRDSDDRSDKDKKSAWSVLSGFDPQLWFNRVDAFHLGLSYKKSFAKKITFKGSAGYKTENKKWGYSGEIEYKLGKDKAAWINLKYTVGTVSRFESENYSLTVTSFLPLLALDDYFDYYWNKAAHLRIGYDFKKFDTSIEIGFNNEKHSNLPESSDYNILGSDYLQRPNPEIEEGTLRALDLKIIYGNEWVPFGLVGQKRVELFIEHGGTKYLAGDYNFTRYQIMLDWRINTFLKRRLLPNALDLRFIGGYSDGNLPVQRFGSIDGNLYVFSPFGVIKSLTGRAYEGENYAALFWEHNFRTVPFELLGLRYLARKGIGIIIYGAHGRTWISDDRLSEPDYEFKYLDHFHHEIGLSINSLFGIVRVDFTQRLDKPGFYVGLGFSRFF